MIAIELIQTHAPITAKKIIADRLTGLCRSVILLAQLRAAIRARIARVSERAKRVSPNHEMKGIPCKRPRKSSPRSPAS
jgi:hypothetical protein